MKNKVSKTTKILFIVYLVLISPFFSSCTTKIKSPSSPPKTEKKNRVQNLKPSEQVKSNNTAKEKVVESGEEFDASNLPLISAVPDKNIYLYAVKPKGVVLYIDGKGHYFDWDYLTPRFILPRMNVDDYDNDGHDELSIILYVVSGTGFAVEDLHIIELSEKELLSEEPSDKDYGVPNPEYFKDNFYKPEVYLDQIYKLVKLKTYYKKGELMANIRVEKRSYDVSLNQLPSVNDKSIIEGLHFGNIVYFQAKDKKLTIQLAFGINNKTHAMPDPLGDVFADVEYNAGKLTMSNLRFEPVKE